MLIKFSMEIYHWYWNLQVNILPDGSQIYVKQEENGQVELVQLQGTEVAENEAPEEQEAPAPESTEENSGQVVAQLIDAGKPAPGGKLKKYFSQELVFIKFSFQNSRLRE